MRRGKTGYTALQKKAIVTLKAGDSIDLVLIRRITMAILQQKPVTPSGRFYLKNKLDLSKKRPEKSLTSGFHRKKVEILMEELPAEEEEAVIKDYTDR